MSTISNQIFRGTGLTLGFLALSSFSFAQTQDTNAPAAGGGFKRAGSPSQQIASHQSNSPVNPAYGTDSNDPQQGYGGDYAQGPQQGPPPPPAPDGPPAGSMQSWPAPNPGYNTQGGNNTQGGYNNQGYNNQGGYNNGPQQQPPYGPQGQYGQQPQYSQPAKPVPAQLTIKQGTFITVRVNQPLSSDHNQAGDAFTATLVRPVVVDGVIVAERGETLGGRVTEADKGGRVKGVSRLGIQLTDLTLADGQQIPLQSQFISRKGNTSVGRDAAAIGTTTALGAAVGVAADWGEGAAIGAGAGAAAGLIGVLLTHGNPTIIYPEQVLTFRVEAPLVVATDRAPQAFRYVEPGDYDQPSYQGQGPQMAYGAPPSPYYGGGASYPYYGPSYYPYYSPYLWGPSFSFFAGPGYFYGHGYYRGGYYGARGYYGGGRGFVSAGRVSGPSSARSGGGARR